MRHLSSRRALTVIGAWLVLPCGLAVVPASAQPVPAVRLSVSTAGVQADDSSTTVGMSDDGRTILLLSAATNLVPGDTNATAAQISSSSVPCTGMPAA